jgi:hypothetical protein
VLVCDRCRVSAPEAEQRLAFDQKTYFLPNEALVLPVKRVGM